MTVKPMRLLPLAATVVIGAGYSPARAESDSSVVQVVGAETTVEMEGTVPIEVSEPEGEAESQAPADSESGLEVVIATEVGAEAEASPDAEVALQVEVEVADDEDDKPWGVQIGLTHNVGTGNFVRNQYVREQADYVAQSYRVSGSYDVPVLDHTLSLGLMMLGSLELTAPDTNPSRRFSPGDTVMSVSDRDIYTEPLTEIGLSATLAFTLPTSYASLDARRRLAARASVALSRSLGPVDLSYSLSMGKNFHAEKLPSTPIDNPREGSEQNLPDVTIGSPDDARLISGSAHVSFDLQNSFSAAYSITEQLSVSYSLVFWNSWKYLNPQTAERDENTGQGADTGRQRGSDMFVSNLGMTFALGDALDRFIDLPVDLSAAAGITTQHGAQNPDNSLQPPLFYNTFANNNAANNFGSFYLSLVGAY